MDIVERLTAQAKQRRRSVVLPEGDDPRILQAARRLHDEGIARPILIGERAALEEAALSADVSLDQIESQSPATNGALDAYAALYVEGRPKASGWRSACSPSRCSVRPRWCRPAMPMRWWPARASPQRGSTARKPSVAG